MSTLTDQLVVAISSRALFDFEEENALFDPRDDQPYIDLQLSRLEQLAKPGIAFRLVKKLLGFNADGVKRVEVVILSRNDPVSGLRVMKSVSGNQLAIERAVFTRGREPWAYLRPLNANLFLSANPQDVRDALSEGFPAAVVYTHAAFDDSHPGEMRIAFDGDAVLFGDDAERVFREQGMDAFQSHEARYASRPLPPGPFKPLLEALHRLQQADDRDKVSMRLRTALVTARSAPAHERAIRTLMDWNIHVDEAMFLGGLEKGPFLREFAPDFYFDDQTRHVESAAQHVPSGHVPHGVANESAAPPATAPAIGPSR
jgi:5'-nucleotidase